MCATLKYILCMFSRTYSSISLVYFFLFLNWLYLAKFHNIIYETLIAIDNKEPSSASSDWRFRDLGYKFATPLVRMKMPGKTNNATSIAIEIERSN